MKMKEWLGRKVRLNFDTETKGGVKFTTEEILVVEHHYRGKLVLANIPSDPEHGPYNTPGRKTISQVERIHVTLLPEDM
jgi:hypothetical protein